VKHILSPDSQEFGLSASWVQARQSTLPPVPFVRSVATPATTCWGVIGVCGL